MPPKVRDEQGSFAGGLNTVSDDIALAPNQFRLGRNARHTEYGAITKRYGSVILAAALPAAPQNGFTWAKADGTAQALAVANGILYTINPLLGIGSSAWAAVAGTLDTSVTPTFAEFVAGGTNTEVVYIGDGGRINKWDGATLITDIGTGPGVRFVKVHNQRLWSCGCSVAPSSIFYSGLNDGDSIGDTGNGGGEIVVRTFADEKVVALASCNSSLLIFHARGLSRLTGFGQDDVSVDPEGISAETGTIAPHSVVEGDGVVFFVSDRGVFAANESRVVPLGSPDKPDPILPLLRTLTPAQLANTRGVLSRKTQEVWFFIPGQGTYIYHLILQAWSGPWLGEHSDTACFWPSPVSTYAETYIILGGTDGGTSVCDIRGYGTDRATLADPDGGDSIEWRVQLRRLYFGDDSIVKSFRFAYITAQLNAQAPMTLDWLTNFSVYPVQVISGALSGRWSILNTWTALARWGASGNSQNYRANLSGTGYYIDCTLIHDAVDTPVVSRFSIDAFALGRR